MGRCIADMTKELSQVLSFTLVYIPLGSTLFNETLQIGSIVANVKILLARQCNYPKK